MHIAFLNPQGNFDPQDRYWTAHPDFGGQLVYVKETALALGRMGHRVDILTRCIRDPQWRGFEATLDAYPGAPNVRIVRLPCGGDRFLRKEELWPYLGTEWLPRIIEFYAAEGDPPEAATAHYGDGGLVGAMWRARGGPPFTFTAHSLGAQKLDRLLAGGVAISPGTPRRTKNLPARAGPQSGAKARIVIRAEQEWIFERTNTLAELDAHYHFARRIAAERTAMSRAARIITSTRQERREQYGHPAYHGAVDPADDRKFAVVPPGVNLRIFDAETRGPADGRIAVYLEQVIARDIAPARRGLPAVLCSSRLDPKKNHVGLVRAFAHSAALRAAANLLIVARGVEGLHDRSGLTAAEAAVLDEIASLCQTHNLTGQVAVFSLDGQQELAAAYRHLRARRSVFALTALYEPFGLAPLEAMAAGLPAVVTRNGGPAESMVEGGQEFGVLVDPTDPADIAAGLLRLVGPGNEWDAFQRAGRQRVLDRYTWERTAAGYLSVIEGMLAGPEPSAAPPPIPAYFWEPTPEHDPGLASLAAVWPQGDGGR